MRWFARLRRTGEFERVRRRGRRAALGTVAAFALPTSAGRLRVGVSVGRAVGGAVVRNQVKRRILCALDALAAAGGPVASGDLVVVARPATAVAPFSAICADVAAAVGALQGPPG